jgi:hypothetical protein
MARKIGHRFLGSADSVSINIHGEMGVQVELRGLNKRTFVFFGATNLTFIARRRRRSKRVFVALSPPDVRGSKWVTLLWRGGKVRFESFDIPAEIL